MNFMSDGQRDGGTIQTFNIIGHYNHEGLGIEVDFSLPAPRVISVLDQIIEWRGKRQQVAVLMVRCTSPEL